MKPIDIIQVEDYKKLSSLIYRIADKGFVVCCVLSYEKAFELLKEIAMYSDNIQLGSIQLQNEDYSGYNREYYVTLDSDMYLDIAPAWNKGNDKHPAEYSYNEADVYFFDSDAHASVMEAYQENACYELHIAYDKSGEDVATEILELFSYLF